MHTTSVAREISIKILFSYKTALVVILVSYKHKKIDYLAIFQLVLLLEHDNNLLSDGTITLTH